jgi:hypothetical protein
MRSIHDEFGRIRAPRAVYYRIEQIQFLSIGCNDSPIWQQAQEFPNRPGLSFP